MDPQPQPQPTYAPQPAPITPEFSAPQPQQTYQPAQPATNPGQGLGIASLVTSLLGIGAVGLILGIIAKNKSKAVGMKNGLATAGIIIGSIWIALFLLFLALFVPPMIQAVQKCSELGPGTHTEGAVTYTCG